MTLQRYCSTTEVFRIKGLEMVQIPIVEEDPVPLADEDLAKALEFLRSKPDDYFNPLDEFEF